MTSWRVTPAEFLREQGWQFKYKGKWLVLPRCPFCDGGNHGDTETFIVHATDGNYSCSRAKCGNAGTFWGLIEATGNKVQDYFGDRAPAPARSKPKKRGFVYGR